MSAKTFELAARAVREAVSETGGSSAVRRVRVSDMARGARRGAEEEEEGAG